MYKFIKRDGLTTIPKYKLVMVPLLSMAIVSFTP